MFCDTQSQTACKGPWTTKPPYLPPATGGVLHSKQWGWFRGITRLRTLTAAKRKVGVGCSRASEPVMSGICVDSSDLYYDIRARLRRSLRARI